jgi:creatinine amidohydrolase
MTDESTMAPGEPPLRIADSTWVEVDALPRETTVLILPVGSTEPHGPHLPLATDVIISDGMAIRAARELRRRGLPAAVLPVLAYAVTDFAEGFAGAVSLRFETARAMIADVLRGAIGHGFRRIAVANSHLEPRHVESLVAAIEEVQAETGVAIAFPDKRRRRWAALLTDEFRSGACHAGRYEGSLVLAERPDLVRNSIRAALPEVDVSLTTAIRDGVTTFREAGGARAYFGSPAAASAEEGEATYAALVRMLLISLKETYDLGDGLHDLD